MVITCLFAESMVDQILRHYEILYRAWDPGSYNIIQWLDEIMNTSGNFKQIYFDKVFLLQPSRDIRLCSPPPSYSFWVNRILERWLFISVIIFRTVFLWPFQTIRRSLSGSFRFLPEFCFSGEVFPSFSNAVITFKAVMLASPNNSVGFVTVRAPTIWPLLKSDRSANFNEFW